MRVLLVKMTSMGDLVHALPAITDAGRAIPDIEFDWVVDEAFADVATWHPKVRRTIKTAHRRWRKMMGQTLRKGELKNFYKDLRLDSYDLVLDGQGNFKSAIVTKLSKGPKVGLDKTSAAESIASFAYDEKIHVSKDMHAIARLRELFAKALGYSCPTTDPDFGIDRSRLANSPVPLPEAFFMFVHNASWESKWWPENYWRDLIVRSNALNKHVVIPWGNSIEHERAQRLAKGQENVLILPKVNLSQAAGIIAKAEAAICVDTGLGHIAAALDIPAIGLYGATDPGLIGATGPRQLHLHADFPCAPCYERKCIYKKPSSEQPACFTTLPPDKVWDKLMGLLGNAG